MAHYPRYVAPENRPTPAQQIERNRRQVDVTLRMSPGSRYWPAVPDPRLPDGQLDIRAWIAQLDAHCNEGLG